MLPLLPIGIALATATVLIKRKIGRNAQKSKQSRLLNYIKILEIPVDGEGKFNPDSILGDGVPLLFDVMPDPEMFTALLDYGANPDICNADGVPAIIKASKSPDSEELVSILLKHGANPNAMDSECKTAIFHTQSEVILTKLASAGADMNATDIHGQTALFHGVIHRNSTEAFLTLKRLGADVNARDSDGKTILFYTDNVATVAYLVHHGADIEAVDNNGEKCKCYKSYKTYKEVYINRTISSKSLNEAVNNNNLEEARWWLTQGADVNIWHYHIKNWSMLHLAVYHNNPEMIELLVKFGADINANRNGIPPLSKAVYDQNLACFKKLLELGADVELARSDIKYCGTDEMKRLAEEYSRK